LSQTIFLGVGLVIVSAIHLIPAILTGEIPANPPIKPLTRSGKPEEFWITFGVFTAAGITGTLILIWNVGHFYFGTD